MERESSLLEAPPGQQHRDQDAGTIPLPLPSVASEPTVPALPHRFASAARHRYAQWDAAAIPLLLLDRGRLCRSTQLPLAAPLVPMLPQAANLQGPPSTSDKGGIAETSRSGFQVPDRVQRHRAYLPKSLLWSFP